MQPHVAEIERRARPPVPFRIHPYRPHFELQEGIFVIERPIQLTIIVVDIVFVNDILC
jgi:hypothetical protein